MVMGLLIASERVQAAGESEPIIGYLITPKGVTFQVISNGCTEAKDFTFVRQINDPIGLELIRKIPDLCERDIPEGVQISFTFAQMGLKPGNRFVISNKMQTAIIVPGNR